MKKFFKYILLVSLIFLFAFSLFGCTEETKGENEEDKESSSGFLGDTEEPRGDVVVNMIDSSLYDELTKKPLEECIKDARKSVVGITVTNKDLKVVKTCTGIAVLSMPEKGYTYIATSHKIISETISEANTVTVTSFVSSEDTYSASAVGTDPQTDIFLMRIKTLSIPTVNFYDNTENILPGQRVFSISNPFGEQALIASSGIICARDFKVDAGEGNFNNMFITDVGPLGKGYGSALFSENGGTLIGMICSGGKYSNGEFVIPADELLKVCTEIKKTAFVGEQPKHGCVEGRFKLGFTVADNLTGWAVTESVSVTSVSLDGSIYAHGLGLKQGDIIERFIGAGTDLTVVSASDLEDAIRKLDLKPGDELTFYIKRGGIKSQIKIIIEQYNYFDYIGIK